MSDIIDFIKGIDDDYLIGLSNKGIVKRSYKDLETEHYEISEQGEEIKGQNGDIRVVLKMPLTNSTCTCPSSSICKHVIMTILSAKNLQEKTEVTVQGTNEENAAKQKTDTEQALENSFKDQAKEGLAEKLGQLSIQELKKNITEKQWSQLLSQLGGKNEHQITYGSMITVQNMTEGTTVKLAYPLSYSTCSVCHNEKICIHKVAALLTLRLETGRITAKELADYADGEEELTHESVPGILESLRSFLEDMMRVGSARLSMETTLGLERIAIRCHEAGLAAMEERLRSLADHVSGYQRRKASVTAETILLKLMDCFWLLKKMEMSLQEGKGISELAGQFRTEYQDLPELMLYGLGMRAFSGAAYDGETVYFLEEKSGLFYTYTNVKPNFYDKTDKRRFVQAAVPWELPCTLMQFQTAKIRLRQGKANGERRLSSTSQAKAELMEIAGPLPESVTELIFDDFELLWKEYVRRLDEIGSREKTAKLSTEDIAETDRLFLIRPSKITDMHYNETLQKLVFYLEDTQGRKLRGQLSYSKQEETAIKSLERLEKSIKRDGSALPVFVGTLYVEDGECTLYPIETIEEKRLV